MKHKQIFAALLLLTMVATSCGKEGSLEGGSSSPSSSSLVGNWKFISSIGTTTASSAFTLLGDELKIETTTSFTSSNPKGIYKITATTFDGQGIGYDYTGSLTIKQYANNVLQSENTTPMSATIPPSNFSSQYKLIGTDSIYFENNAPGSSTGSPGGCKYKVEGNKLSLFLNTNTTTTTNQGGIITTDNQKALVTVILQKQ